MWSPVRVSLSENQERSPSNLQTVHNFSPPLITVSGAPILYDRSPGDLSYRCDRRPLVLLRGPRGARFMRQLLLSECHVDDSLNAFGKDAGKVREQQPPRTRRRRRLYFPLLSIAYKKNPTARASFRPSPPPPIGRANPRTSAEAPLQPGARDGAPNLTHPSGIAIDFHFQRATVGLRFRRPCPARRRVSRTRARRRRSSQRAGQCCMAHAPCANAPRGRGWQRASAAGGSACARRGKGRCMRGDGNCEVCMHACMHAESGAGKEGARKADVDAAGDERAARTPLPPRTLLLPRCCDATLASGAEIERGRRLKDISSEHPVGDTSF